MELAAGYVIAPCFVSQRDEPASVRQYHPSTGEYHLLSNPQLVQALIGRVRQ
jgi:hypothetical protein